MDGIIVAADRKIEWLLDFWWSNYAKHNEFPVTFVDFGMSTKAQLWCQERGRFISLPITPFIASKSQIEKARAKEWEAVYGKEVWKRRQSWFKKPLALMQTPYDRTIWLDLDCEVLGPIGELFELCKSGVALAKETEAAHAHEKEQGQLLENEILYNSGVIVYKKGEPLMKKWAETALHINDQFWGDQQLLSRLIHHEQYPVIELGSEFNWRMSQGVGFHAVIIHWVGSWGKTYIRKHGGLSKQLEDLK